MFLLVKCFFDRFADFSTNIISFIKKSVKFSQNYEVIVIEVKIPKEVRRHKETIFFGLSARQFLCAMLAVGVAAAVYLGLGPIIGKETASWLCILAAVLPAAAGFFQYNNLTLEQFLWAFVKSQILCAGGRPFVSESLYYRALDRKGCDDFD